jgi:hypothetical protein
MSLMKGAFVVFQTPAPVPSDIIMFQFNAESLQRKIEPPKDNSNAADKGGGKPQHQTGRPTESFSIAIDLDAADRLADDDAITRAVGLHPAIAQLELLLYPQSSLMILNAGLARAGVAFAKPLATPNVLFVWGTTRILPVRVTSVSIHEQQFDHRLNPINARVDVGVEVLKESELSEPFKTLAMITHVTKEGLSRIGTAQSAASIGALHPF